MSYDLYELYNRIEGMIQTINYSTYDERDQGRVEAYSDVLDEIRTMTKEVKQWELGNS
jgi:hypothetical protein